ncbi:potassium voltage-gated channel subfamily E member 2-like [Engraulis encrasicolus]|uniref:potassium voltage-gated channel subfamily E member 2-like n=1 Tax=Engraulis encrasicolus TaxID=184585 RepID=UPI002FD490ED
MAQPDWSNMTVHLEDSLTRTLSDFLNTWRWNSTAAQRKLDERLTEENFRNVIWYLLVMIGMFSFIVVAVLVSTVKSKRSEHSEDPYHKYIEGEWTSDPALVISNPSPKDFGISFP